MEMALIMAGASILSNYLANKNRQQQTQNTTSGATFNKQFSPLIAPLMASTQDRMRNAGLPPGYGAAGIDNINRTYAGAGQALQNRLTSQGLGGTPIMGAGMATLEGARAGSAAQFQNQLPLLQQQMQDQANQQGMALLGMGGGQTTNSVMTGGGTNPGAGAVGAGIGDASQMLAYLYGQGYMGGGRTPTSTTAQPPPYYLAQPNSPYSGNPWGW